ncbi:hypothetical protein BSP38_247 [Bacillus phage BSP38]|uniref:Uncharacterized protein n=1 Tax=Bacillus phage BSP38 TaxID=2283013 RepID=A0A345MKA7_BPBSP|nr:hypothetical protein HWB82_gp071 [Bacillus phage BSP38]AXH71289.1 hypothetical protein BSP38_247 [Bacillus phage BSP38]
MPMTTDERTTIRNTLLDIVDLLQGLNNKNPTQVQEIYILLIADRINQLSSTIKEQQSTDPKESELLLPKVNSLIDELR